MGLDMYLTARRYVGEYSGGDLLGPLKTALDAVPGLNMPTRHEDTVDSIEIKVPVMYWRKFNALHGWFVREVQDGKDECQESVVSWEKLTELDALVTSLFMARVPAKALEAMPPVDGFFFGWTEIDEWFWEKMRTTMEVTGRLLEQYRADKLAGWEIVYQSSW